MRKIISGLFVSLDGVAEAPDTWHFEWFDDEMGAAVGALMADNHAMLLGRRQYEEFAAYWPTSDDDFAEIMNGQKKYVVTNTLTEATWNNTEIISGDVMARIKALKEEGGKNLGITGSLSLVRSLLTAGLLDELHLMVHPVVVGRGARWFDGLADVKLELLRSEAFSKGVVNQVYGPVA
ncbi:dihydrofolate reductase family protein [Jiangella asiatica]|uniref:Dihydrofolate reductase n=1 Tax=Jiangella asiatica TaxID=2530372 RepID=A0A4R5DIP0_9ACTN|nr:dihydrofolate reductase family protein [Jiangella asiatica]TDE11794.1 dihydrofolate reductase [Jiangella asiatica]